MLAGEHPCRGSFRTLEMYRRGSQFCRGAKASGGFWLQQTSGEKGFNELVSACDPLLQWDSTILLITVFGYAGK